MNDEKFVSAAFLGLGLIFLFFGRLLARLILGINRALGLKGGSVRPFEIAYIIAGLVGIVIGAIGWLIY